MANANGNLLLARFAGNPAASLKTIEKVQQSLNLRLPKSYVDLMLTRNGGEGFIGRSYLVLWKIKELVPMNAAYHVAEFAPKLVLFGSNGGDEAFGFDTRSKTMGIVSVPFVGMDLQLAKAVAADFDAFLLALFR